MSAAVLAPLPVVAPLVTALALIAGAKVVTRRVTDALSVVAAVVTTGSAALLAARASGSTIVYWLGGWQPVGGSVVGIPLVIDTAAAGLAAFTGLLTCAAFVYSWKYLEEVEDFFHVLVLLFLGGMVAFCLVGDLFTLFVTFELMTVAAVALTAYHPEDRGPLQGAFTFGITNLVGSFLSLTGVALLYGRAEALNLAAVRAALAGTPADGFAVAAFTLVTVAFLVKAAAVPFHFWLADAHAVAPAPVCMLLSGIMVSLGLYGVGRVYWVIFSPVFADHEPGLRALLVGAGALTAVVGAVLCPAQGHLKRLLAYSTIAHIGVFVIGLGALSVEGLTGTGIGLAAHGFAKAALFCAAGLILNRYGLIEIGKLHGRGRDFPLLGVIWVACALALADLPGTGMFVADARIAEAATMVGQGWAKAVLVLVPVLTGGALLAAGARVFLGYGTPAGGRDPSHAAAEEEDPETTGERPATPAVMVVPAVLLALAAVGLMAAPGLEAAVHAAAERFHDGAAYAAAVLGQPAQLAVGRPPPIATSSYVLGALSTAAALGVAGAMLWGARAPVTLRRAATWTSPAFTAVRRLHSGHVGDNVAWLVAGTATLGALLALATR